MERSKIVSAAAKPSSVIASSLSISGVNYMVSRALDDEQSVYLRKVSGGRLVLDMLL